MSDVQIDVRRMFVESFTALNEKITGFPLYYSQRELPCNFSQNIKIKPRGHARALAKNYVLSSL